MNFGDIVAITLAIALIIFVVCFFYKLHKEDKKFDEIRNKCKVIEATLKNIERSDLDESVKKAYTETCYNELLITIFKGVTND